jgi:hypothetical protein
LHPHADLAEVGNTPDTFPFLFTAAKGWKNQGGKNRDDSDDDQKLNESEPQGLPFWFRLAKRGQRPLPF